MHRMLFSRKLLVLTLACLLGCNFLHAEPEVLDGIAAVVNDEVITFTQVRELTAAREEQLHKDTTLNNQQLKDENRVLVAKALAVEKHRITLGTLITALFYDLSTEKPLRIPTQSEKRERALRDLVKKGKRPVVLFVDEAHDLTRHTLTDLKRLLEVVEDGRAPASIAAVGRCQHVDGRLA